MNRHLRAAARVIRTSGPCSAKSGPHSPRVNPPSSASPKRGVLLLIALVMLALFMLLGTSYILIANRRRPCTAAAGAIGSKIEDVANETTTYGGQNTLTGQPDGGSHGGSVGATVNERVAKYFTNSLLADKYGDWYEQGTLASISPLGGSMKVPFYTISFNVPLTFGPDATIAAWSAANPGKTPDLGSQVGRILSIESEFEPNAVFRIVARQGSKFIAHLVNPYRDFDHRNLASGATLSIQGREFSGDTADSFQLHENYDAPDNRNLFMAWVQTDAVLGRDQQPGTADDPADGHRYVIPSFHRPDKLLATIKTATSGPEAFYNDWLATPISLLRPAGKMSWDPSVDWTKYGLASAPPLPGGTDIEHPNFTGGNVRTVDGTARYFDPLHGPWDVDNDGDGITDSIWLDIGMSPVTIGNAQVQPLVAMMIVDLDGRVNLNAHGNSRDLPVPAMRPKPFMAPFTLGDPPDYLRYAGTVSSTTSGTAGPAQASLPHAQGWGPGDIDLRQVFGNSAVNATAFGLAASGSASTPRGIVTPSIKAEGRYGDSAGGTQSLHPAAGRLAVNDTGVDSPDAAPRDSHFPSSYGSNRSVMSPIDPLGAITVGLDQFGQPYMDGLSRIISNDTGTGTISTYISSPWTVTKVDDPYDLSLGRRAPRPGWAFDPDVQTSPSTLQDNLFTAPQFERLLRLFEPAADKLSPRLVSLLGTNSEKARVTATIESWDTPGLTIPRSRLEPLLDLTDQTASGRKSLVSWDLALGLRMDVNRPFGDGIDNDADGIADEPGEFEAELTANVFGMSGSAYATKCLTNGRDVDGDGNANAQDQYRVRELYARHLYVLVRTMAPAVPAKDAAQWAVNVVDMRDPDSIITRFPFDANSPSNNDWDPSTDDNKGNVVWGCERPELLITEAMAWRNIRTGTNTSGPAPDIEYSDKGTGGLVVELFHPWSGVNTNNALVSGLPAEFQPTPSGTSGFSPGSKVDLAKVNSDGEPVFQLVAVLETGTTTLSKLTADPTWPQTSGTTTSGTIPRLFISPAKAAPDASLTTGWPTFVSRDGPNVEATTVSPGQFALVSGPTISGTGGPALSNVIDISASGTAAMEFNYNSFSDTTAAQPLQLSSGLTETITGSSGFTPGDRSSAKQYPRDGGSGPVGALVCVENVSQPTAPLRFIAKSGTTTDLGYMANEKYRVLLRRLANPQAKYDATLNPYICIDSLVVQDQAVVAGSAGPGGRLESAERCASQPANKSINNIWRHASADDDANTNALAPPLMGPVSGVSASLGFLPARLKIPSGDDTLTETEQPVFPWLTWLNREFASEQELLLVPKSSPATLLRDHTHDWPFKHLFFQLGSGTSNPEKALEQNKIGILELLRVPSRFADAETPIPAADAIALSNELVSLGGKPLFLPPHNYLSHFREPGRVNLNTMSSRAVWEAINGGRPGAPYEDEVAYSSDGTAATFQKSEDWLLTSGSGSSPLAGNWQVDNPSEDVNGNNRLDVNHDENNDGKQQVSKVGVLQSISASRRGWPIAADGSTPPIAGQFDRVLNRKGVAADQLWFSKPFQSGWTSDAASAYAASQSLMVRHWAGESPNFMRMPQGAGYRRLKRTNGVTLTAGSTYVCSIKFRGNVAFNTPGNDKLPELLLNNNSSNPTLDPNPASISRLFLQDSTSYTSVITPSTTGSYNLQIAIIPQADVDVLSVSLVDLATSTELLTNGKFSDGETGWQSVNPGDATLQTDQTTSKNGPVFLMATNLSLKDSKGNSQDGRPYADPRRNPYFRYREMMRLSNLTTSRSNVFAVWMTVGFFVIEPHPARAGDTALGAEYGLETGDATRFKSFMIIDRSLPVGFRPGVQLNSRDSVLLDHFGN